MNDERPCPIRDFHYKLACPICNKKRVREIVKWSNHREYKLVILVPCNEQCWKAFNRIHKLS